MNACKTCGKETKNNKFCSRSCSAKTNNIGNHYHKPRQKICKNCSAVFEIFRGNICKTCKEKTKEIRTLEIISKKSTTLKDLFDRSSMKGLPRAMRFVEVRNTARSWNKHWESCAVCDYQLHIEICHIRPVSEFPDTSTLGEVNDPLNIIGLCPNHHWELDNGFMSKEQAKELSLRQFSLTHVNQSDEDRTSVHACNIRTSP